LNVPRSSHADLEPSRERRPPEDVLLEQAVARAAELVPIGDGPVLASPFAAHLGSGMAFDRAIAAFAGTYADQDERDRAALDEAARAGRIATERGA
jgi:hypothetical protein